MRHSVALHGVVLGYCHPRGGGEKGEDWYKAGYKATKPNTWKDFIACAEYLTKNGYTSPGKLAGTGTSAGGILISRAITERPDLFAAAVCNVGCANAMRREFTPNGPVNIPEFGTVKDPVEVKGLSEMDGVLHVQPGVKYPAVLGVAGWNDPRVVPWQPGKFVAALQAATTSGRPVLMKVNYDNGHFTEEKTGDVQEFRRPVCVPALADRAQRVPAHLVRGDRQERNSSGADRMGRQSRRVVPGQSRGVVDDLAERQARSRHVLHVVPHDAAVRPGASGAAPRAR